MNEFTAEAIDKIVALSIKAQAIQVLNDDNGQTFNTWDGAEFVQRHHEAPLLNLQLTDPWSLVKFVRDDLDKPETDILSPLLAYSSSGLCYIRHTEDKRDRATCSLELSKQLNMLRAIGDEHPVTQPRKFDQKAFVRLLRIDLDGCLPSIPDLLESVRSLKFGSSDEGASEVQHGRESMGKSLQAKVFGQNEIPEEVTLDVSVFTSDSLPCQVRCAVEILPEERVFRLVPFPGEIDRAIDAALARIIEPFADLLPCYRGTC